jgi:hypothetical protein
MVTSCFIVAKIVFFKFQKTNSKNVHCCLALIAMESLVCRTAYFFLVKNCDQRKHVFDLKKIAGMEQAWNGKQE